MKKRAGLWIDRERAFILIIINGEESISIIESGAEAHIRALGGSRSATPYAPQDVAPERKIEEKRKRHLRQYYKRIIGIIQDSDEIVIFGPGEAKLELKKEIEKSKVMREKIVGIESADKMTERQMRAWIKTFFNIPR